MCVDCSEPAGGIGEKGQRRHDHCRHAVIETSEPGADQAHIMIEWQPAHEHVSGTRIDRLAHRPDIGQKVGMGQDDAFRIASGARRVLNKGDGFRVRRGRICDRLGPRQARHRLDLLQTFGKAIKQLADRPDIVIGDQNAGLGIAHDTRLPAHMFLHPRPARWRIDRHRHASCEKDAGKRVEKPGFRRQHDGHTITWAQSALEQSLCDPPGGEIKLGIGDGQRSLSAPPQEDMRTQGVFTHMPVERFNKRTGRLPAPRRSAKPAAATPRFGGSSLSEVRRPEPRQADPRGCSFRQSAHRGA